MARLRPGWIAAGVAVLAVLVLGLLGIRGSAKYEQRNRVRQAKDGVRDLALAAREYTAREPMPPVSCEHPPLLYSCSTAS